MKATCLVEHPKALILAALFNPMVQHKDNALATVLGLDEYIPSCVKKVAVCCMSSHVMLVCEVWGVSSKTKWPIAARQATV